MLAGILVTLILVAVLAAGSFTFFGLNGSTSNARSTQTQAQNLAADATRKAQIATIDTALKLYYAKHSKIPGSLADLVITKDLTAIPYDPITHQPPTYALDEGHGCRISFTLSDGSEAAAYCQ